MKTVSASANRPKLWEKMLFADVMDDLYFMQNGLMGEGENNIIQVKTGLSKQKGNTINVSLTAKLTGNGVDGDNELEGNEEEISAYSDDIVIDQKRFGVVLTGALDEQINAYDMRMDAKEKLKIRWTEFMEQQFFLKLAGVTNTSLTDVNGIVVGTACAWSNSPNIVPTADTDAGYGARYLNANYVSGAANMTDAHTFTPGLISKAKTKAKLASPKIQPLRIDGQDHYVMFIHPWQADDLKNDATYNAARRDAAERGNKNPIFTGALGVWDNVILFEHEYVPYLDVSVAGNSFTGVATGTDFAVDSARALLVGKQAGLFAQCKNPNGWVEETRDYKNVTGFAGGLIGGIQKLTFNSKDYSVIAVDTAVTVQN